MKSFRVRLQNRIAQVWLGGLTLILVTLGFPVIHPHQAHSQPLATQAEVAEVQSEVQEIALLIKQGRTLYEASRFSEAAQIWQQAVYQTRLGWQRSIALNYLSLAHQELGNWQQAEQNITQSLNILQTQPDTASDTSAMFAQALTTQGKLQLSMGQPELALESWQQAAEIYDRQGNQTGQWGSQINQAQALQALGLYHRAQTLLEQVNQSLQQQPDSLLKGVVLHSLGTLWQVVGDLKQSQMVLEQSLNISRKFGSPLDISTNLFSLANTVRSLQEREKALVLYQEAADIAPTAIVRLEALINQVGLLIETKQWETAEPVIQQIQPEIVELAPSRSGIYLLVNLATSLMQSSAEDWQFSNPRTTADLLVHALQQAKAIQDKRAESYALGQMGELYEKTGQPQEAKKLTQQALLIAQSINANDVTYRWQWQLGRLYKQQGDRSSAIVAYTEAVNSLQSLRHDLVSINPNLQFSFREKVEPVYRELVGLLMQPKQPSQSDLEQARKIIETLQVAELENFFRSTCLDARPIEIDSIDRSAAVIYPILLDDRVATILSLPGQPLHHYQVPISKAQLEATAEQLLQSLNPIFSDRERLKISQAVYDWLVRPAEQDLAQSQTATLVFVLDGVLRNLPMSALYDGQQYLVEKYNVAIAPGLQLLESQSIDPEQRRVLIGGLTEPRQGFAALPSVEVESNEIADQLVSKVFLNQNFTIDNLHKQIQDDSYSLIHLATHGQFSSNVADTFILTWNDRITIEGLRTILQSRQEPGQNPIELLVLSACETAAGDQYATLGLAGLAVRSGARSTLATLWSVNDVSTAELMANFYQALNQPGASKAQALRQAQIALLKNPLYQHPFYWAPFILIGNWL